LGKEKIFIYTDSRGFLVNCFLCDKTPYKSYIEKLSNNFFVSYKLCPYKHTTILDFLEYIKGQRIEKYSTIILHIGIVDFSPRPISQCKQVFLKKNIIVNKLFKKYKMSPNCYDIKYENEKTFSLYDFEFLKIILDEIIKLSLKTHIIWIGVNEVDLKWRGNYFKDRPKNINMVLEYQKYIESYLKVNEINTITYLNLDKLKNFDSKKYTVDNMHFNKEGFEFLYKNLIKNLKK
jgi:hypothetical protein